MIQYFFTIIAGAAIMTMIFFAMYLLIAGIFGFFLKRKQMRENENE